MRKIRKSFAVLAMMLSMCMVIPATVHANELAPDSTPTATIAPDETSESSGEIPADPTAPPEITAETDETPAAEETVSPKASVLPEATPDVTASPEATPTVPIRRAPSAVTPMSVMKSGVDFNIAIKRLSGQTVSDGWNGVYAENTTIKAFVVTEDAPPEGATTIDLNTFPTGSGGQPLLAWFDSATGTVYCQSTTPRTTLGGDCTSMFQNMTALEKVDFHWTRVAPTNMSDMFCFCRKLTSLDVSGWNTSKVTDMSSMFYGCSNLNALYVLNWDTSSVTDMNHMFYNCYELNSPDVSKWGTSRVTDMSYMFYGCSGFSTLNVSNWDTSNVTNMSYMFYNCRTAVPRYVWAWDTSRVTDMSFMFYNCRALTTLDVSNWNTGRVTNMSSMFDNCVSLTTLDVSKWDTSKVTNMSRMFAGCNRSLTALNVSNWNTGSVTNMSWMFAGSKKLTALDVSSWTTSGVTDMSNMFSGCSSLKKIVFGPNFTILGSNDVSFPAPANTVSGAKSNGRWGLDSEVAATSYDADGLNTLGKTAGALTGTWYAQKLVTSTVHFDTSQISDVEATGTMPDQVITGKQKLNANAISAPGYTFYGWTTEENSWQNGTGNGVLYADQAEISATGSDITLYAYFVPADRNMTIRVLDTANNPVPGVTVRYWQKYSSGYDSSDAVVKGEYTTGNDGTVSAGKYRLVFLPNESSSYVKPPVEAQDASWNGVRPYPTGGYNFQITAAPDGYKFAAGRFGDAEIGGYENLSGTQNLSAPDDYTISAAPTISAKSDGSYLVTLYVSRPAAITYDANGGSGTMETQTLSAAGPLNPLAFTRDGYWFTGWNTAKDGSGTAYADQAEFTPAGKDVTLYAQWKTGVELPEAGYPGDPSSRIVGPGIALFGVLMIAVMFSKDEK